jgi:hypothetical protein
MQATLEEKEGMKVLSSPDEDALIGQSKKKAEWTSFAAKSFHFELLFTDAIVHLNFSKNKFSHIGNGIKVSSR